MIISPPFLPVRAANQTDDAWLDAAMVAPTSRPQSTGAPEGSFPLSSKLEWHNGMHLQGQAGANGQTVVRAIADGKVVYVGKPNKANNNADDAQNFNPFGEGPTWTDNGCVIVEHTTEIGAAGAQATEIVYYSVYMHLSEIARITPAGQTAKRILQKNDNVWRKDEIGNAGQIYSHAGQTHLEICVDEANLTRLIGGRAPAWVDLANIPAPTADGRTDSVFGAIWFYLPASTPTATAEPNNHLRSATQPTLNQIIWLKMTYASGACAFESYDNTGRSLGALPAQANAEYNLYTEASRRHKALPSVDKSTSSPSGWYELLRFGRNLGRGPAATDKDPLPANAAHWRKVPGADGQPIWADLNAEGTYKFSDADFLPIQGWNFVNDDSTPDDQRCDSSNLKNLIADPDTSNQNRMETTELARRLGVQEVAKRLRRMICRFPSEWNQSTIETRYAFVKELDAFKENPDAWKPIAAHMKAISFSDLPTEYIGADWRFHPREFIGYMRRCGWLSLDELVSTFPRYMFYNSNGNPRTAITTNNETYSLTKAVARARIQNHTIPLNKCIRKYIGGDKKRIALFLAQVLLESAQWRNLGGTRRLMHEWGFGQYSVANPATQYYGAFYGRGIMQLTWAGNYKLYGEFRSIQSHQGAYVERLTPAVRRITDTSSHYTFNPSDGGQLLVWHPRYDPDIVGENAHEACDSGGFYWVSKAFSEGMSINRVCDRDYSASNVGMINRLVNGGGNGYYERMAYSEYMVRQLLDSHENSTTITINPPAPKSAVTANMAKPE